MKRLLALAALLLSLAPLAARAQVAVNVQLGLPAAPPLVVVQPGVQVVENYDEEVFYTGGWYWVRRDGRWWRARQPRAQFVYVEPRYVPARIVRIPPGQYRHWNKERDRAWREQAKAERREFKERRKEEKREWKEERREHGRGEGHGEGHGHGHGHGRD